VISKELLITIVGSIALILSILLKVVGLPDQIKKDLKRKSTEGLSTIFIILFWLTYIIWTMYGILKEDWFITIGHGVGVVTTGIILLQIRKYKKVAKR